MHVDTSELRLAKSKLSMSLAIECPNSPDVEFRGDAGQMNGAEFLRGVVEAFPYAVHAVLTDNGMALAHLPTNRNGPGRRCLGTHIFDHVCAENGIEHELTETNHPWTNGQAERMNRSVQDATIKSLHYPSLESFEAHVPCSGFLLRRARVLPERFRLIGKRFKLLLVQVFPTGDPVRSDDVRGVSGTGD